LYDKFKSENKKKLIFDNFIYGDIHWNINGTKLIKEKVVKNINF
tara:strand:- start:497 stop:628 length:132 start_codon:yes stop_codon:yes gene_type:complete